MDLMTLERLQVERVTRQVTEAMAKWLKLPGFMKLQKQIAKRQRALYEHCCDPWLALSIAYSTELLLALGRGEDLTK